MVMHSVALSSTTAPTATTACPRLWTVTGDSDTSTRTGPTHAAFCSVAVTRKSTSAQNRCWYTPPAAMPASAATSSHIAPSTPPVATRRPAQAASTAATPSSNATTRCSESDSPRNIVASTAVTTGFIDTTTASSTAGAPCCNAKYRHTNGPPCASNPLI